MPVPTPSDPAPPVPADALGFRVTTLVRAEAAVYAVFGLAFLVLAFASLATGRVRQPSAYFWLLVVTFGTLGASATVALARFRFSVAVNPEGLWYLAGKSAATFIPWSDVSRVEARHTAHRLVLVDARDGTRIRLSRELGNFAKLREYVLSHTSSPAGPPA